MIDERLLHRMQHIAVGQAFDRDDRRTVRLRRGYEARHHGAAVEPHRARAALALGTAFFRTGQAGFIAQRIEQREVLHAVEFVTAAVDRGFDPARERQDLRFAFRRFEQHGFGGETAGFRTVGDLIERAFDERGDRGAPIGGGRADIVDRRDRRGGDRCGARASGAIERAAGERGLGVADAHDRRRDAAERDAGAGNARSVEFHHYRDADHRDGLRFAQAEFEKNAAARGAEFADGDRTHEFARCEGRAAEAGAERLDAHAPPAGRTREFYFRVEDVEGRDRVVGRRRRDKVSGDGAARADLRRADFDARLNQRQRVAPECGRTEDVVVRGERAQR